MTISRRRFVQALIGATLVPVGVGRSGTWAQEPLLRSADRAAGPRLQALHGDAFILGHMGDEHLLNTASGLARRDLMNENLKLFRRANVDLLIDTGDLTDDNAPSSYALYDDVFEDVLGFSRYPDYGSGIPLRCLGGNHDYYGGEPFPTYEGEARWTYDLGDYRLIAFSNDPNAALPSAWLAAQLEQACSDAKFVLLFHHYPPHGWVTDPGENMDMSASAWATIDTLAQQYPVLAYLCGHQHSGGLGVRTPGYVAHATKWAGGGYVTLYALSNGHININAFQCTSNTKYAPVVIVEPAQYLSGLAHTETQKGFITVRAYSRTDTGTLSGLSYQLDGGALVSMPRVGESDYYEASLDATALSGEHTLKVSAKHSFGSWATGTHIISAYFGTEVTRRAVSGCTFYRQTVSIPLHTGWNLISLPVEPILSEVSAVFGSIDGLYDCAYCFDAQDGVDAWKRYEPGIPDVLNDLRQVDARRGIWIRATATAELIIEGGEPSLTEIPLQAGWNLVGFPSSEARTIADALVSIENQFVSILAFAEGEPSGPWLSHTAGSPPESNTLMRLEPGHGYWLQVSEACTWLVEG